MSSAPSSRARRMMYRRTFARASSVGGRTRPTARIALARSSRLAIGKRPGRGSSAAVRIAFPCLTSLRISSALRATFTPLVARLVVAVLPIPAPHPPRLRPRMPGSHLPPLLIEFISLIQKRAVRIENWNRLTAVVIVIPFAAIPDIASSDSGPVGHPAADQHRAPGARVAVADPCPADRLIVGFDGCFDHVPAALKGQAGRGTRQRDPRTVPRLLWVRP